MDSRTLWAIILVGVVWFGWQQYINKKYGSSSAPVVSSEQVAEAPKSVSTDDGNLVSKNLDVKLEQVKEELVDFEFENFRGKVSTKGMSLKNVSLLKFNGRDGNPVLFSGGTNGLFATYLSGSLVDFKIDHLEPNIFLGVAQVGSVKIQKKMIFGTTYGVQVETTVSSAEGSIPPITVTLEDEIKKVQAGSIFSPPTETQEVFVLNSASNKSFDMAREKDGVREKISQALVTSINAHYFSASYVDRSDVIPSFLIDHSPSSASLKAQLQYEAAQNQKEVVFKSVGYIGPKDVKELEEVDVNLSKMIKFGWFSAIAKPLLFILKWLNSFVGNWGFSIILLTLLVRMIVMPLHIMSFRSMKAMQKVQPLIQNIREKYKDDSMAMNRETMELMKKHKVNPLGGCLPMLLQIPVFFALYRVFSESIDLYQAPFIFWIHDLSMKDPFFVLPVLMATVMFLQQKMTPTTMDPSQAKVMQFMPLIFSLMMVSLPSGLTLYMFVSTFFGILQQYFFLKDKQVTTGTAR